MKKQRKNLILNYDLLLVPKNLNHSAKTYRFTLSKALILIMVILIISNSIILFLISYTPIGKILPDTPYIKGEDYSQIIELREKVFELSKEVERVRKINERLNLIIEGKAIPTDPRDLDTNYQLQKMKKDSLNFLGKNKLTNNLFFIVEKILMSSIDDNTQVEDNSKNKDYIFFMKPADGLVTRGFNKDISHYGIDFSLPVGSVVRASASGIVVFADYTINDGYKIIISHSRGYITVYKHLSQILKRERDYVKQGDIIGLSGNTGKLTTGPHLHFEIWKYQTPIDPQKILVDLK